MMKSLLRLILAFAAAVFVSCSNSDKPSEQIVYEGISFEYPSYWVAKTEKLEDGHFFIDCYEKFDKETIFLVSFFSEEGEPDDLLESYFDNIEGFEVAREPKTTGKFGQYECISCKYKLSYFRSKYYGEVYTFNAEGKLILVIKQSERDYDLKHKKYKKIENSFKVERQDAEVLDDLGEDL